MPRQCLLLPKFFYALLHSTAPLVFQSDLRKSFEPIQLRKDSGDHSQSTLSKLTQTVEVTINRQKRKPCTDAKPSQTWNPALWFVTCDSEHNTWQRACAIFRSFMISSELPTGYATATTSICNQRSTNLKLIQPGCEHLKCFYLEMSFGMVAFQSVPLFRTAHSKI